VGGDERDVGAPVDDRLASRADVRARVCVRSSLNGVPNLTATMLGLLGGRSRWSPRSGAVAGCEDDDACVTPINGNKSATTNVKTSAPASSSSYYVLFLGSRESGGLRGAEHVRPVITRLLDEDRYERKRGKVTLQVSRRGVRIVQQHQPGALTAKSSSLDGGSTFVPHGSVTTVVRGQAPDDDVVSCIFLVSSAATSSSTAALEKKGVSCPLVVNCFRCDSSDTAEALTNQLQAMVDRPENKAKFDRIEQALSDRGIFSSAQGGSGTNDELASSSPSPPARLGSDGQSLGRSSDSSESGCGPLSPLARPDRRSAAGPTATKGKRPAQPGNGMSDLHRSLAEELKKKLEDRRSKPTPAMPAEKPAQSRVTKKVAPVEQENRAGREGIGKIKNYAEIPPSAEEKKSQALPAASKIQPREKMSGTF